METLVRASLIAHHNGLDDEIMKMLDTKTSYGDPFFMIHLSPLEIIYAQNSYIHLSQCYLSTMGGRICFRATEHDGAPRPIFPPEVLKVGGHLLRGISSLN